MPNTVPHECAAILSLLAAVFLVVRAVMPAQDEPAPCRGFSASLALTHCSMVVTSVK